MATKSDASLWKTVELDNFSGLVYNVIVCFKIFGGLYEQQAQIFSRSCTGFLHYVDRFLHAHEKNPAAGAGQETHRAAERFRQ